eukprot:CAMPEP_0203919330 /NCGR_PEP_ID=MMETSP0359-20131031/59776_1 /ASSEMBLY_ACC=CAM_ASM_000338 /TAXON_ID=268821 /ORGANISM="Scrippsiella Hangoei, Strain SHTV-5" /LENGTH=37 /DNA_ID= /DNA_START= /DNA_END= /DNA_ORIENTATION=
MEFKSRLVPFDATARMRDRPGCPILHRADVLALARGR